VLLSGKNCQEVLNDSSVKYGLKSLKEMAPKTIEEKSISDSRLDGLSFRVSVFEQSPGTLLVKGSLIQTENSSS
ncbi:hypothetical protein KI387_026786, partial [Taxus chinensis]